MADSNITKRALAAALKELMQEKPFPKISIGDICEKCEMNRNSFYYHFKDKYDLVNWIYYTEFVTVIQKKENCTGWELLEAFCAYFYENRSFYSKTLRVEGQNSFAEYLTDIIAASIAGDVERTFGPEESNGFMVEFYTDAFICAIRKWLLKRDCMPAEEFANQLRRCFLYASEKVVL